MISKEFEEKVEEMRVLEHQLQNFLAQKQTLQVELNEIQNALQEIEKSDEVYRVVSGIMIKSTREKVNKELQEKKKIIEIKINSMEKQEEILQRNALNLRREIEKISKNAEKK